MILLKVKPEDKQKPLTLHLETQLQACGSDMFCNPEYFINELTIDPDGNDILFNGYDNFFFRNASLLPHKDGKNLHLQSAVIDEYQNTQSLRLKFTTTAKVKNFKVFVEEKDGYTKFSAPGISINDNQINVQFQPLEEGRTPNLINSEFTVTAVLNTHDALRTTVIATKASLFDAQAVHLNFALLLLAILGGLILNFMPCVFPVLSLKIMAISQAVGNGKTNIKHSLRHTIYGIFSGFTLITAVLLLAKYAGYSLGWGMQFQNMSFLVIMLFVLAAFIAVLPHVNFADIYHYTASSDKLNFTAGTLIVLLSTPCTAPYLATAVGFALTGGYTDIICILYAIALGVSLPYILLLWLKNPADLFPKPGAWLKKLDIFMQIMLYLTIIWLLTLVYNQTDGITIAKIVFSIFTFALCFRLYMMFLNYLQGIFDEEITLQVLAKARRIATALIFGLFAGLCFWCSHTATYKQQIRLTNVQSSLAAVDTDLIAEKLKQGKSVLLEISADWCMTCHVNNILALKPSRLRLWKKLYNLELIKTDWTNYNRKTLDFMEKYGRKGLPFYVLYTPLLRDGIVLPEMFSSQDLENLLANSYKL
jgi:suppressor for copper-sensitivity B